MELAIAGLARAEVVGRGGFATVYRAWQEELNRFVAVKVLPSTTSAADAYRFQAECRAMGQLSRHPGIVTLYGSGTSERNEPFLVMELMPHGSLADEVNQRGARPWQRTAHVGIAVGAALAYAHEFEIVHRDVKPENVMVSEFGAPALGDFGIARLTRGQATEPAGPVHASLAHAPPEVVSGQGASERSDVWSLGSTLATLLLSTPPFLDPNDEVMATVIARILTGEPRPLPVGVPAPVREAISWALAKNPRDRPTAWELVQQLQAAQRHAGVAVTPVAVPAGVEAQSEEHAALSAVETVIKPELLPPPPWMTQPTQQRFAHLDRFEAGDNTWPLCEPFVLVGRWDDRLAVDPQIDLTDIDTELSVSRRHASVEQTGRGWVLRDLGSANGTTVNARLVDAAVPVPLTNGTRVQFGDIATIFRQRTPGH